MLERIRFFSRKSTPAVALNVPTAAEARRRRQLRMRQELSVRQTADFYYLIDVVGTCNLTCPSCPVGNYPPASAKGLMSLDTYREILDKIVREHPGEKIFIDLYNWGEPALHKHLGQIVRMTRERGYGVGISSNLNVFPDMKNVVAANPSYIRVSLSGYFPETYSQTHRRGDINLFKANLHQLRYWIDKLQSETIVQVGFHVYRSNFPEDFRKMRALCEDLGFIFAPTLAALMPVEKAVKDVDGDPLAADRDLLDKLVVSAAERVSILAGARKRHPDCQYRQLRTTINFDGSVPLCCATYESEQIIAPDFLKVERAELQARKYAHPFCGKCMDRSLDMVYTAAEPHLVEERAVKVLGQEYADFLAEWNAVVEPVMTWQGREMTIQDAYNKGRTLVFLGQADVADELFAALLKEAPRHGDAMYQRGLLAGKGAITWLLSKAMSRP